MALGFDTLLSSMMCACVSVATEAACKAVTHSGKHPRFESWHTHQIYGTLFLFRRSGKTKSNQEIIGQKKDAKKLQ